PLCKVIRTNTLCATTRLPVATTNGSVMGTSTGQSSTLVMVAESVRTIVTLRGIDDERWLVAIECRSTVAIVLPRQSRIRVTAYFPEALLIAIGERDLFDPLGAFPGVTLGHDHPDWPAVFLRQRSAVPFKGQQHVVIVAGFERQVGGVVVVGFEEDVLG